MDSKTIQALIKWPDTPFCYGWLFLDRRGRWRLRNEFAQKNQLPGDEVKHLALLQTINQHIAQDAEHQYFFQNGPQRVYIDLAYTPYVVRLMPNSAQGWDLQTHLLQDIQPTHCYLDEKGNILFACTVNINQLVPDHPISFMAVEHQTIALLHDHDLEIFSSLAQINPASCGRMGVFRWKNSTIPIKPIRSDKVHKMFDFKTSSQSALGYKV